MRSDDLYKLPEDLPAPVDDGAANHLRPGLDLPHIFLPATDGKTVDIGEETSRYRVFFFYPRTGNPDHEPVGGIASWNRIPGARGCTPQMCGYRDHFGELSALGAEIFGVSTQTTGYQQEAVARLLIPFPLLSDRRLELTDNLKLPFFKFGGETLLKRLTLIARKGAVEKVLYPVFPPDKDAEKVIKWLKEKLKFTG